LRLIDSCITQLKAQGTSRTCNESKAEEEGIAFGVVCSGFRVRVYGAWFMVRGSGFRVQGLEVIVWCLGAGYRGTSLIRNNASLGPYSRTMHRAVWWS